MSKRWLLLLCLVSLPLLFLGLCHRSFTDNEGMYAEVGREILLTGDWLTTRVNGSVYLNKPPLLFWLTALVLKIGGLNLLPALVFIPALLLARRARDIHRYCAGWGLLLAAAIVLPWHVAAGIVNPGFWWDYVINQHLLYFFDRKYPHDSVSHPLWFAWAAFAGRLAPWALLLPAAALSQIRRAKVENSVAGWLPLTWLGMVWLFFSVSRGRLEHYFLPAVPAAALLV